VLVGQDNFVECVGLAAGDGATVIVTQLACEREVAMDKGTEGADKALLDANAKVETLGAQLSAANAEVARYRGEKVKTEVAAIISAGKMKADDATKAAVTALLSADGDADGATQLSVGDAKMSVADAFRKFVEGLPDKCVVPVNGKNVRLDASGRPLDGGEQTEKDARKRGAENVKGIGLKPKSEQ
jgi:hypothetical protein